MLKATIVNTFLLTLVLLLLIVLGSFSDYRRDQMQLEEIESIAEDTL